jgi:short subunit dehydrogenase-like uncharacterized protein
MLYGAYGATGRRILDEALRRGHRPLLAGRDGKQLAELARATGLAYQPLALEDGVALRTALLRVRAVMNAAGPYRVTGPAMRAACLAAGCSYFDINGELEDFSAALACDAEARARNIAIVPGVGYGVVFGESLATHVASLLPDATWLRLSLATQTAARSRGASLSTAGAIASGGREIRDHQLQQRALASSSWRAPDPSASGMRFSAGPLAELMAAHRSTGIANIVAGIPLSRAAAILMRFAGPAIGKLMMWGAARAPKSPGATPPAETGEALHSRIWAEAGNAAGQRVAAMLETGEGYGAASASAVRAIELQLREPRRGALTPAQAFGARFALLIPGTHILDLALGTPAS